jgi:YidC/Oxa1 family membrane protein insertase
MDNRQNLIVAVILSAAILFGWEFFVEMPRMQHQRELAAQQQTAVAPPSTPAAAPSPTAVAAKPLNRDEALAKSPRIKILSSRITGSIALIGGRIDDVDLVNYRDTIDPDSPEVQLLTPSGTENAYFADFGWVAKSDEKIAVPGPDTLWKADHDTLTPDQPVTLSWDNGQGLAFSRTIALDQNFMFTVTQGIENHGANPVTLSPYARVLRSGTPKTLGYSILYEGPIGYLDGNLYSNPWFAGDRHVGYKDLQEKQQVEVETSGGWLGFTDKYWLAAVVPDPSVKAHARFKYWSDAGVDSYQTDFLGDAQSIGAGDKGEYVSRLFSGAKEVRLLDHYSSAEKIERLDLAVDFGLFYFLTKPFFYILNYLHDWLGNFGLAIMALTVIIKLLFLPLANRSYRAMGKMRALQPEILKLRERFTDDRQRLNQEMMELYKREKVNPAAGCLPIFIQIPVFFSLYKVLFVTIEMRHAPFYGWIKDLSAPDPTDVLNLFGLIPWDPSQFHVTLLNHEFSLPALLLIGAWPMIMGVTMFLQQRMNPPPPDPVQARIFMFLPLVFTFMLARFPAGLVIYWAWNNILSVAQQWFIMRQAQKHKG